jgi:hypothetical protein
LDIENGTFVVSENAQAMKSHGIDPRTGTARVAAGDVKAKSVTITVQSAVRQADIEQSFLILFGSSDAK